MKNEINIAEILKDKLKGTKLYDYLYDREVYLDEVITSDGETSIWCVRNETADETTHYGYSKFGTLRGHEDGLSILKPSKTMRDWSRFAWKKGDVLISKGKNLCIFEQFEDDTYKTFRMRFLKEGEKSSFHTAFVISSASYWTKAKDNVAKRFFNSIEEKFGGKLNMETLEVEKAQPEFKDGDILFVSYKTKQEVFILSIIDTLVDKLYSYIVLDLKTSKLDMGHRTTFIRQDIEVLRHATEAEKQQLFSAFKKEGWRWNAKQKVVEYIKPKWAPKPFDKVIVKAKGGYGAWRADFFSHMNGENYICTSGKWDLCLPYNEQTAHLVGTTDNWED